MKFREALKYCFDNRTTDDDIVAPFRLYCKLCDMTDSGYANAKKLRNFFAVDKRVALVESMVKDGVASVEPLTEKYALVKDILSQKSYYVLVFLVQNTLFPHWDNDVAELKNKLVPQKKVADKPTANNVAKKPTVTRAPTSGGSQSGKGNPNGSGSGGAATTTNQSTTQSQYETSQNATTQSTTSQTTSTPTYRSSTSGVSYGSYYHDFAETNFDDVILPFRFVFVFLLAAVAVATGICAIFFAQYGWTYGQWVVGAAIAVVLPYLFFEGENLINSMYATFPLALAVYAFCISGVVLNHVFRNDFALVAHWLYGAMFATSFVVAFVYVGDKKRRAHTRMYLVALLVSAALFVAEFFVDFA